MFPEESCTVDGGRTRFSHNKTRENATTVPKINRKHRVYIKFLISDFFNIYVANIHTVRRYVR